MLKFQEGDVVRISQEGKNTYPDEETNPYGITGVVTNSEDTGSVYNFSVDVRWSNGMSNAYRSVDLELINVIVENE